MEFSLPCHIYVPNETESVLKHVSGKTAMCCSIGEVTDVFIVLDEQTELKKPLGHIRL
jgi:hypothetical protein